MSFNQLQNRLSNMIDCPVFNKVKKLPRKMKTSYIFEHQNSLKHRTFMNRDNSVLNK